MIFTVCTEVCFCWRTRTNGGVCNNFEDGGLILCWLLGAVLFGVFEYCAYHLLLVALWDIYPIKLIYHDVGF